MGCRGGFAADHLSMLTICIVWDMYKNDAESRAYCQWSRLDDRWERFCDRRNGPEDHAMGL